MFVIRALSLGFIHRSDGKFGKLHNDSEKLPIDETFRINFPATPSLKGFIDTEWIFM